MPDWQKTQGFAARQLTGWWRDCCVAGAFLTRLPFPPEKGAGAKGALAKAARAFPLVGAAVGVIAAVALTAGAGLDLHPVACGFLAVGAAALVTGALHEDGLADVADGFGGGGTPEAKLKIMKDSRIGTFGVLAVVISVGVRAGALAGFDGPGAAAAALIAAGALSRGLLPAVMAAMAPARKSGLAVRAGTPDQEAWVTAAVMAALLAFLFLGPVGGMMAIAAAVIAVAAVLWLADRQIGGVTGDVLGTQQQAAEAAVLIAAAAL